ncbi:hypothetical protein ACEUD2_14055 [Aeromonas veronii]|uniref:Uncharacterized protein n=1 Tax=Aeromonas allosaccharophila TaxID=656 RepID=A0ABZ0F9W9_9GAMM|nr:hypothetical protein [Aeromonas allosaccharophila]WOE66230.1 hypothetical protein RY972_19900 [Aeromonas allosaccharophila]
MGTQVIRSAIDSAAKICRETAPKGQKARKKMPSEEGAFLSSIPTDFLAEALTREVISMNILDDKGLPVNYAQRQALSLNWLVTLNNISEQITQISYEVASARREIAATLAEYPAPAGLPALPEAVEVKIPREGLFLRKLHALRVIGARRAGGCK